MRSFNSQELFDSIKNQIEYYERPIEEAVAGNDTLKEPTSEESEYDKLWQLIKDKGFAVAFSEIYKEDYGKLIRKGKRDAIIYSIKLKIKYGGHLIKNALRRFAGKEIKSFEG